MFLETDFRRILNSLTFAHIKKQSISPTGVSAVKPLSQYDTASLHRRLRGAYFEYSFPSADYRLTVLIYGLPYAVSPYTLVEHSKIMKQRTNNFLRSSASLNSVVKHCVLQLSTSICPSTNLYGPCTGCVSVNCCCPSHRNDINKRN